MSMHNPSHPGELLRTWIEGANLTVTQLADHIGVTRATLSRIINGHAGVTAEMDLRLHQALGTREGLWLDLQKQRDLWVAKQVKTPRIKRLVFAEFGAA
jgi:antitoxin HigA-1